MAAVSTLAFGLSLVQSTVSRAQLPSPQPAQELAAPLIEKAVVVQSECEPCERVDAAPQSHAELRACREDGWSLVKALFKHEQRDDEESAALDSDFAAQNAELCDITAVEARKGWNSRRDSIVDSLSRVGTETWIDEHISDKLSAHERHYDLDAADREALEEGYVALWYQHEEVQQLIADEDWVGLIDSARDYWRDEDQLVTDLLGAERAATHRAADLRGRTSIMAIFATLGDLPWGQSIAW